MAEWKKGEAADDPDVAALAPPALGGLLGPGVRLA